MQHNESVLPRNRRGDYSGGIPNWRVAAVHYVAKAVGLLVHIEGMPLGTSRNLERGTIHEYWPEGSAEAFRKHINLEA